MQSEWNRDLGNMPFKDKMSTYEKSEIGLTKELASLEDFTRTEIDTRQAAMADVASEIWSLKFG